MKTKRTNWDKLIPKIKEELENTQQSIREILEKKGLDPSGYYRAIRRLEGNPYPSRRTPNRGRKNSRNTRSERSSFQSSFRSFVPEDTTMIKLKLPSGIVIECSTVDQLIEVKERLEQ